MTTPGLIAREDSAPVDFAALRRARFERVLAAMEAGDLDVLILSRTGNLRYAAGVRQLWMDGTRPFGPACVIVRENRSVHLLGTGEAGVPPEIPRENLICTSFNPGEILSAIGAIKGVAQARRVGVDGMTPQMAKSLRGVMPEARYVNANAALGRVRAVKTADELVCLTIALGVAEGALAATLQELCAGITELDLRARYLGHMARTGVTVPALDPVFTLLSGSPPRQIVSGRAIDAGAAVLCHVGAIYAGYEGSLMRTVRCPSHTPSLSRAAAGRGRDLFERWRALMDALVGACRPGVSLDELRRVYEGSGEPFPTGMPLCHGVGTGLEPPVAGARPVEDVGPRMLETGMVLALNAVAGGGDTGYLAASETVYLAESGPQPLTRLAQSPLDEAS